MGREVKEEGADASSLSNGKKGEKSNKKAERQKLNLMQSSKLAYMFLLSVARNCTKRLKVQDCGAFVVGGFVRDTVSGYEHSCWESIAKI